MFLRFTISAWKGISWFESTRLINSNIKRAFDCSGERFGIMLKLGQVTIHIWAIVLRIIISSWIRGWVQYRSNGFFTHHCQWWIKRAQSSKSQNTMVNREYVRVDWQGVHRGITAGLGWTWPPLQSPMWVETGHRHKQELDKHWQVGEREGFN